MVTFVLLLAAGAAMTLLTLYVCRSYLPKCPNHTGRNIPT
jgi:hypothetical protein